VLRQWLGELNAVIETGTRVGVAAGDLWPINIGSTQIEITLLGDPINLAARLEKNCATDETLIDNRTHSKAVREDAALVSGLGFAKIEIPPGAAKGQQFPIPGWTTNSNRANDS
jgi:adenylate cyclase